MPRNPAPNRDAKYPSAFGHYRPRHVRRPTGPGKGAKTPKQAADELATRFDLRDPAQLLHHLHCLADDWATATVMDQLVDTKRLEDGRLGILSAVTELLEKLDKHHLAFFRLKPRLHNEDQWGVDSSTLHNALSGLQYA